MSQEFDARTLLWACSAADPVSIAQKVEALPQGSTLKPDVFRTTRDEALIELASWLASDPEEKWRRIPGEILKLWTVGGEDIY